MRFRRVLNVRTRRCLRGLILASLGAFFVWLTSLVASFPIGVLRVNPLPKPSPPPMETDPGRIQESIRRQEEEQKWGPQPNSTGLTLKHYLADMDWGVRNLYGVGPAFLIGVIVLLVGYGLMIWGILTAPTAPILRSLPSQLGRASDKIEGWDRTIPAEPDAISRPRSSDIQ
jgi:hypothetical protein